MENQCDGKYAIPKTISVCCHVQKMECPYCWDVRKGDFQLYVCMKSACKKKEVKIVYV